jgi:hypothetical protein
MKGIVAAAGFLALLPVVADAGEADVIAVQIARHAGRTYDFEVTVRSRDTGWDAYADAIEVLGPDGAVLKTRVLEHPHQDEQPFSRDVYGVRVPAGAETVTVRAHHKTAGYDGAVIRVQLR